LSLYHNDVYGAKDAGAYGYTFNGTGFEHARDFDLEDHTAYYNYRHLFKDTLQGSFTVADEHTVQADAAFRNAFSLRPALSWLLSNGDVIEVAYTLSLDKYYFPTTEFF